MDINYSDRLKSLPPYLFMELDRKKQEAIKRGIDVIDFGIGDPDLPTPEFIIERMINAIKDPKNHRYPSSPGSRDFRLAVAKWCKKRFNLNLDPDKEVVALIGSKEGIAHLPFAFLNPGDIALVPTPAYPVYNIGTQFANGISYFMPLRKENNFLPDLDSIPQDVLKKSRLLWLNYPNNPTAAIGTDEFYKKVIEFAHRNKIIVCHDAAYSEVTFDGYRTKSILEYEGAKEVCIEFHSLSKTYNMTGWRIGFAIGNEKIVKGLRDIKSNVDSGQFNAIQEAAIAALESDGSFIEEMRKIYTRRRDTLYNCLTKLGLEPNKPLATFYIWCPVPKEYNSTTFSTMLLEKAGIICTPGVGFGDPGEGYVRFSLTVPDLKLNEAVERLQKL